MSYSFEIVPIPGREVLQRNFARLPAKSDTYSKRELSLNERFSIIERGYYLKPIERQLEKEESRLVKMQPIENLRTTEDILTEMRVALDEKKKPNKNSHSNNATLTGSPPHNTASTRD